MNNYITLFVATLEHLGHMTHDEAEKLAKEFGLTTLPDNYRAMSQMVGDKFEKHGLKKIVASKK